MHDPQYIHTIYLLLYYSLHSIPFHSHFSFYSMCRYFFPFFFFYLFFCSLIVKDVYLLVRISIKYFFFLFSISYTHTHFCRVVDLFNVALHSHRMEWKKSVSIKFYSPYRFTLLIPHNITITLHCTTGGHRPDIKCYDKK